MLGGVTSIENLITENENSRLRFSVKPSLLFSFSFVQSLLPKYLTIQNLFLQLMLCRVAAVKRLPVHHHSADYISWSFRITGFILSYYENRVLFKPMVGDVASVVNLIAGHDFFLCVCSPCFQKI